MALSLLAAAAPTTSTASSSQAPRPLERPESVPREVLVRFDPGTGARARDTIRDGADVRLERRLLLPRTELMRTRSGQSVREAIAELESQPDVAYAEPNYIHRIQPTTPNDTLYSNLWGLNNTGQTVDGVTGTADADIDAPEAWDTQTGSSSVIVAVLDSGLAYDRSDIAPHLWTNPGETANGLDDGDPNTLIDDLIGWDFVYGDNDPRDGNDHGTHVAGTIGAVGNNSVGVVGVNWTTQIMPIQVCDHLGSCPISAQIDGINYAALMGADVINMSIGGSGFSQAQRDAIDNATNTFFAVAAGNEGANNDSVPSYPCSHTVNNLVCVAAGTQSDGLASFSNFGATSVDLAAPGTNVLSTLPSYDQVFFDDFEGANNWDWVTVPDATKWERTTEVTAPSPTNSIADSSGGNYAPSQTADVTLAASFSLAGRAGCTLGYELRLATGDSGDFVSVRAATSLAGLNDAASVLDAWTGSTGGVFDFIVSDLEGLEGQATVFLRFRFVSDGDGLVDNGAHIDDVEVLCADIPDPGTRFGFFDGTSMATPHVAGVAALMVAEDPSATVAELRSSILNSVDLKPAFSGTTVTGGRLNASRALAALTDGTPPSAPGLLGPPDGSTVNTTTPTFSWNPSTDVGSGIMKYQLLVDGGVSRDGIAAGTTSATPGTPLTEGLHFWGVRAFDFGGNVTDSSQRGLTVDLGGIHPRSITLTLKKHLKAKGTVSVLDGFAPCIQAAAVEIERKAKGSWKTIKSIVTDPVGAFSTTLPDRDAKYRGQALETTLGADTCAADTSPRQRHRHPG